MSRGITVGHSQQQFALLMEFEVSYKIGLG